MIPTALLFLHSLFLIVPVLGLQDTPSYPEEIFIPQLAAQVANLTQQINMLKTRRAKTVMFTAHMKADHFTIPANGYPFRFDQVITNIGDGYNPNTGVFHTPVSGNYLFILQLMGSPGTEMEAAIKYEGVKQTLLYVYQEQDHDMSTVTSLVHLNQGEEVTVERYYSSGPADMRGGLWSQFSGSLLRAD